MGLLAAGALVLPLIYLLVLRYRRRTHLPLPPGPPGLPLVGNLFDWPASKRWEKLSRWAEIYGMLAFVLNIGTLWLIVLKGDIVYANVFGTHMIILNSFEALSEVMLQKGATCSDRPHLHFLNEIVGWRDSMVMLQDGPHLKEQRRLFVQAIGTKAALQRFASIQEERTTLFLSHINKRSDELFSYIRE
jgi:cytochrome P450